MASLAHLLENKGCWKLVISGWNLKEASSVTSVGDPYGWLFVVSTQFLSVCCLTGIIETRVQHVA